MSSEADRIWDECAGRLRKKKGFCPLTPEEAAAAFNAAPIVPLSEDRIDSIVRAAISGETRTDEPEAKADCEGDAEVADVTDQAYQLCRNKGDDDKYYPAALPGRSIGPAPLHAPTVIRAGESLGTGPGYTDDPRQASAEVGQRYLEAIARGLSSFLLDFHRSHPSG